MTPRALRAPALGVVLGAALAAHVPAQLREPEPDHVVRLLPFEAPMLFGRVTARALAGARVQTVEFWSDGKLAARAEEPPFEATLRLPPLPEPVSIEAVGKDEQGRIVGRDRMRVNLGHGQFAIQIAPFEFRGAGEYTIDLEVDVPYGEAPPSVELFWNDERLGTLDGPPYRPTVHLPAERGYLRALARRANGEQQEAALLRAQGGYAFASDVDLVELHAVARGPDGRVVRDLDIAELIVEEDGVRQQIRTVESGEQVPLTVCLALDVSTSMRRHLATVKTAALHFVEWVLAPRDRALLVSFSARPELLLAPTGDRERIASAVASLQVSSGTALWDALVFSLVQLRGISGRKAVVVLTDGDDRVSGLTLQHAAEYSRRAGLPIYLVRLRTIDGTPPDPTELLRRRLIHATGGSESFLDDIGQLEGVYREIADELLSQYVISYQSSAPPESGWRSVTLELRRPGVRVRTRALAGSSPGRDRDRDR